MRRLYNFCLFVASPRALTIKTSQRKSTECHLKKEKTQSPAVAVSDSVSVTTHKALTPTLTRSLSPSLSGTLSHSQSLTYCVGSVSVVLLITFGSAHDVAGNASKLKLPEAQSRLGLGRLRLTHWKSLSLCPERERACVPEKHSHSLRNG